MHKTSQRLTLFNIKAAACVENTFQHAMKSFIFKVSPPQHHPFLDMSQPPDGWIDSVVAELLSGSQFLFYLNTNIFWLHCLLLLFHPLRGKKKKSCGPTARPGRGRGRGLGWWPGLGLMAGAGCDGRGRGWWSGPGLMARAGADGWGWGQRLQLAELRQMPQTVTLFFERAWSKPREIDSEALHFGQGPWSKLGTTAALGKSPINRALGIKTPVVLFIGVRNHILSSYSHQLALLDKKSLSRQLCFSRVAHGGLCMGWHFPPQKWLHCNGKSTDFFGEQFIKLRGTEGLRGDICHIVE